MSKKAFTFIELLVVITIIVLISSTGVIYFFKQVSSLNVSSEIDKVIDIVDNLDSEIENKKILDYNIYIKNNDFWLTWSINNLWINNSQNLNMNFDTWTWIITSNSWTYLKIYWWIKLYKTVQVDSSNNYSYNFWNNVDSKIESSYSWSILNEVFINYYSPDNIKKNNEDRLELTNINTKSDKSWTSYNSLEIKNINWKKIIIPNWWSDINKIYLFFERWWVEKFIEIKK